MNEQEKYEYSQAPLPNIILCYGAALLASLTSFFAYPEISVLLLLFSYSLAPQVVRLLIAIRRRSVEQAGFQFLGLVGITMLTFGVIYWRYGLMHNGEQIEVSIFTALYFSVTTLTTLGFGDFSPTPRLRHITSLQAIIGFVSLGVWIGLIGLSFSKAHNFSNLTDDEKK